MKTKRFASLLLALLLALSLAACGGGQPGAADSAEEAAEIADATETPAFPPAYLGVFHIAAVRKGPLLMADEGSNFEGAYLEFGEDGTVRYHSGPAERELTCTAADDNTLTLEGYAAYDGTLEGDALTLTLRFPDPEDGRVVVFYCARPGSETESSLRAEASQNGSENDQVNAMDEASQWQYVGAYDFTFMPSYYAPGKEGAVAAANYYIEKGDYKSRRDVIEGLQNSYTGYTEEEAVYAADNCGADWRQLAVVCAESHVKHGGMSYQSLIDQLEYEGFSAEEAAYGADNCGTDWYQEAVKKASSLSGDFAGAVLNYSKEELIEALVREGFTREQAEYGVAHAEPTTELPGDFGS